MWLLGAARNGAIQSLKLLATQPTEENSAKLTGQCLERGDFSQLKPIEPGSPSE